MTSKEDIDTMFDSSCLFNMEDPETIYSIAEEYYQEFFKLNWKLGMLWVVAGTDPVDYM